MKPILLTEQHNYIGVFLTFACNLKCSYCINYFGGQKALKRKMITGPEWVKGLNRIVSRDDLPITLQGGEPSLHPDFYYIINNVKPELNIDLMTNLQFDVDEFMKKVSPERIRRKSPYASIRVSYHPEQMNLDKTLEKTKKMLDKGYSIGIWCISHPSHEKDILASRKRCEELGIDFRVKEFLGEYNGQFYGKYKYEGACDPNQIKHVKCRTTELLIDSEGKVFRCHSDLYAARDPIGSILDPESENKYEYRDCDYFGCCNPCDVKVKTNRLQEFGHTSVDIEY